MNEVVSGESICPVCEERLDALAPRCFRCTTELTSWWPLEEALRSRAPAATHPRLSAFPLFVLIGGLLGFAGGILSRGEPDRSAAPARTPLREFPSPPVPESGPAPVGHPAFLVYTVQPGDSLWRVAASLTGDGQNWRKLWPEYEGKERGLRRGASLEIPFTALKGVPDSVEKEQ